jgi:hypothetical protein
MYLDEKYFHTSKGGDGDLPHDTSTSIRAYRAAPLYPHSSPYKGSKAKKMLHQASPLAKSGYILSAHRFTPTFGDGKGCPDTPIYPSTADLACQRWVASQPY